MHEEARLTEDISGLLTPRFIEVMEESSSPEVRLSEKITGAEDSETKCRLFPISQRDNEKDGGDKEAQVEDQESKDDHTSSPEVTLISNRLNWYFPRIAALIDETSIDSV
jgi:hypothetical protein